MQMCLLDLVPPYSSESPRVLTGVQSLEFRADLMFMEIMCYQAWAIGPKLASLAMVCPNAGAVCPQRTPVSRVATEPALGCGQLRQSPPAFLLQALIGQWFAPDAPP
jgi:hypothetical protein